MCGITGIFDPDTRVERLGSVVDRMADSLSHRGPDDRGTLVTESQDLAFGHRRLSVMDLDRRGRQPMVSDCGRFILVFNGEIYNFKALRKDLEQVGCRFRTTTDSEVLLEACARWGVRRTAEALNGMFAFALFDRSERTLHLVRDRVGIKPLLLWSDGRSAAFASEVTSLESCPIVPSIIDPHAVRSLLHHSCIFGTRSILKDVEKVMPGCIVSLRATGQGLHRTQFRYWDPVEVVDHEHGRYREMSFDEQSVMLEGMLSEAVHDRLNSDVPLGCFLSGGVDSSLVVALAQRVSEAPIQTFTIGMPRSHLDESAHARRIARHLGTDHHEHMIDSEEAIALIPRMPEIYDEPFADSSQIPTFLVSQIARKHVTVALSGDGGDELFGGYSRYTEGLDAWRRVRALPGFMQAGIAAGTRLLPDRILDGMAGLFGPQEFSHRCRRLVRIMGCDDVDSMHDVLASTWDERRWLRGLSTLEKTESRFPAVEISDPERMMFRDFQEYLVSDILTKLDRASMSVSLEARVPMLDHRLVEMAWGCSSSAKISARRGKLVLRDILSRHMPSSLFERPKMGFSVPLAEWLRGPLREWCEHTLFNGTLQEISIDADDIRLIWNRFLVGDASMLAGTWSLLMLSGWLEARSRASR